MLVVEGQSIRFCQQCGRYQLLEEFDGDRRSCRRKLERHNERRRRTEELAKCDEDGRWASSECIAKRYSDDRYADCEGEVTDLLEQLARDSALHAVVGTTLARGLRAFDQPVAYEVEPEILAVLGQLKTLEQTVHANKCNSDDNHAHQSNCGASMQPNDWSGREVPSRTLLPTTSQDATYSYPHLLTASQNDGAMPSFDGGLPKELDMIALCRALSTGDEHVMAAASKLLEVISGFSQFNRSAGAWAVPQQPGSVQQALDPISQTISDHFLQSPRTVALSLKLFNLAPEDLSIRLLQALQNWMASNPAAVEGAMRPGCLHIGMSALLTCPEVERMHLTFAAFMEKLSAQLTSGALVHMSLVSGHTKTAVMSPGGLHIILDRKAGDIGVVPEIVSISPIAVVPNYEGTFFIESTCDKHVKVFCRKYCSYTMLEVVKYHDRGKIEVNIPDISSSGLYTFDLECETLVSAPYGVVVIPNAAAAAELCTLEWCPLKFGIAQDKVIFMQTVGMVVQYLGHPNKAKAYDEDHLRRVAGAAHEIMAACIVADWPALARFIFPACTAGHIEPRIAVSGITRALNGVDPFYLAIITEMTSVLAILLEFALENKDSYELPPLILHLAVLLRNPKPVITKMLEAYPGLSLVCDYRASNSASPSEFAIALGKQRVHPVLTSPTSIVENASKQSLIHSLVDRVSTAYYTIYSDIVVKYFFVFGAM